MASGRRARAGVALATAIALGTPLALSGVAVPAVATTAPPGTPAMTATPATPASVPPAVTFHGSPRDTYVAPKHVGSSPTRTASSTKVAAVRSAAVGAGPVSQGSPAPAPRVGQDALELDTFSASFDSAGHTYAYRMVGTDPTGPGWTTTVPTTVVPITVRTTGDAVSPSSGTIAAVTSSGLFTPRAFPGGRGQYGDVFVRTQFWSVMNKGAKGWHVVLGRPSVGAPLVLDVPEQYGRQLTVRGVRVAFVDVEWLDAQLQPVVTAQPAGSFTQLLAGNVVLCEPYDAQLGSCGIGGYHSATTDDTGTHTYSYQAFLHSAVFGAATGFHDLGPMSHELAEWLTDPYTDNVVPGWLSPLAPQYGCVTALESGDPVVGRFLTVGGLTYQDEAYLSWFARHTPSTAWLSRYTWLGSLTTSSPSCPS